MFNRAALAVLLAVTALGVWGGDRGLALPLNGGPALQEAPVPACRAAAVYGVPSRLAECADLSLAVRGTLPGSILGRLAGSPGATRMPPAAPTGDSRPFGSLVISGATARVSMDAVGNEANGYSCCPTMSADGRYVAFYSDPTNLVPADTNNRGDIFVKDMQTGAISRVTVDNAGNQANDDSFFGAISADGRFVVYASFATNLVPGDTALCGSPPFAFNCLDVFVRDRQLGTTERASVSSTGVQANDWSYLPAISGDGRYIAYFSYATNLVPGDNNNTCDLNGDGFFAENCPDVFLRDRQTGTTTIASLGAGGVQANAESYYPAFSEDGRYLAFTTLASNLVPGDTNNTCAVYSSVADDNCPDVLVRDLQTGANSRVSVDSSGLQGNDGSFFPVLSGDGRYVGFASLASNLVPGDTNNVCDNNFDNFYLENCMDVFVRDRQASTTTRVSVSSHGVQGNSESFVTSISNDGRFVGFTSWASNLVPGDTNNFCDVNFDFVAAENCPDAFVHHLQSGTTVRASISDNGLQANDSSFWAMLSGDGRYVAFDSAAANLVPGDTNLCDVDFDPQADPCPDIFRRDLGDADGDGTPDPFDFTTDTDGDYLANLTEAKCGSDPWNAGSIPERIDTPGDDDGDAQINEALPPGAAAYDCDGDGYRGTAEANVGANDQDLCGGAGWPSDLVAGGLQPNTLNIEDLGSFITPVRRFATSPGHPNYNVRWDLVPGGTIGGTINLADVAATITGVSGYPPMFEGLRAFGKACPWAP